MSDYHRGNPAPGVRIDPIIGDKVHITQSQRRLARTPIQSYNGEYAGVFKHHMIGGAVGLGMMSAVSTLRSPVVATGGKGTRPGHRRRGHCRMGSNTVFAGRMPQKKQYREREIRSGVKKLMRTHLYICTARCDTRLQQELYETARATFLSAYPEAGPEIVRIEAAHRTIK